MTKKPYPLIILGAGASFDSLPDHGRFSSARQGELKKWQPPLTNDLFDKARFDQILANYPEADSLAGEVFLLMRKGYTFEGALTDILDNLASKNPIWYRRLMSVRLYLRHLFSEITDHYFESSSNYRALVSEIERKAGRACFVSFNYDLLLEKNIFDVVSMTNVDDYIDGPLKVVKIHGAYNWFRPSGYGHMTDSDFQVDGKKYLLDRAQKIFQFEMEKSQVSQQIPRPRVKNVSVDWQLHEPANEGFKDQAKYFVPDLALPINKKRDFICPEEHIQRLISQLNTIDRVIIVGWKAADQFLLGILREHLPKSIPVFIVSSSSSEEVAKRLNDDYGLRTIPINKGFTEFINDGDYEAILSADNMDVFVQGHDFNTKNKVQIVAPSYDPFKEFSDL